MLASLQQSAADDRRGGHHHGVSRSLSEVAFLACPEARFVRIWHKADVNRFGNRAPKNLSLQTIDVDQCEFAVRSHPFVRLRGGGVLRRS